jgi:hypothetical protein
VLSAILFGTVSVVVLNSLIYMLDRLPGELQRLFAMSTFVVSRALQLFRGCLQMAESFLHVGLIFTEAHCGTSSTSARTTTARVVTELRFTFPLQLFRRIGIDTVAAGSNEEGITT